VPILIFIMTTFLNHCIAGAEVDVF
jgi:hypothetical protein